MRTCRHVESAEVTEIKRGQFGQHAVFETKTKLQFPEKELVPLSGLDRMTPGHLEKGAAGKGMRVCRRAVG